MDNISPQIARKLLAHDFTNLAQRVQQGGKLSRSERTMLQGMSASTGQSRTVAENYVELAKFLGVARRTLQRWRKRKDAPEPLVGGFHEIAAWRTFMERHGLQGDVAISDEETALRARKLLAEVEERELRLAVHKRQFIALEEVKEVWTKQIAKARDLLRNKFEMELPPILSGLDAMAIEVECRKAMDEVLAVLKNDL